MCVLYVCIYIHTYICVCVFVYIYSCPVKFVNLTSLSNQLVESSLSNQLVESTMSIDMSNRNCVGEGICDFFRSFFMSGRAYTQSS